MSYGYYNKTLTYLAFRQYVILKAWYHQIRNRHSSDSVAAVCGVALCTQHAVEFVF